jgi:hypothetical protein
LEFDIGFLLEVSLIPGETRGIGRRSPAVVPGIGKGGSAWAAILIYGPLLGIMAFGMPETVLSRWGKLSMA